VNACLFETFSERIDSLPPEAVLEAAAEERRRLEGDLARGKLLSDEETDSILAFCRFLAGAIHGSMIWPGTMPMEHWTFYVKTVGRLVAAEQLPPGVKKDIEAAFQGVFCCIMG